MALLTSGVILWAVVHSMPAVAPAFRQGLIDKLGQNPYRGVFALALIGALVLIILGWRSTPEMPAYAPIEKSGIVGFILMIVSFILIGAAQYNSMIKQVLRHPMLLGVAVWSVSHLITNGSTRALVLFGGIGLWALIEIPLINARDKEYTKPPMPKLGEELKGVFISAAFLAIAVFLHPYFSGVDAFPR